MEYTSTYSENRNQFAVIIKCIWRNSMSYDFVYIYRVGHHIKFIYKLNRNRRDTGIQTMLSILTRFSVKIHTWKTRVNNFFTFSLFCHKRTHFSSFMKFWIIKSSSWNNKVSDVSEWQCLRFGVEIGLLTFKAFSQMFVL